jgi:ribosomal protein L11 methylase PrmA
MRGEFLAKLAEDHWIIGTREVDKEEVDFYDELDCDYLVEHEKLPVISYPYEWSFEQLKVAAIFHLDFQLALLSSGYSLKDASAYNVQFRSANPVFIDLLSIQVYRDGDFWEGQNQFTQQFLVPLLLSSEFGIPHNAWYRGAMEGIEISDYLSLLPWYKKYSLKTYLYLTLPEKTRNKFVGSSDSEIRSGIKGRKLTQNGYKSVLLQLRGWISALEIKTLKSTRWSSYSQDNTYSDAENRSKHTFLEECVKYVRPELVVDLGCNTGAFSRTALAAGATTSIGLDSDSSAVNSAFRQARASSLNFLPLYFDAVNPTPNMGWNLAERSPIHERVKADFVIALAFIHHLIIARNIPIDDAVEWIVQFAPNGIIEFVEKTDPTVRAMLALREDIFNQYTKESFEKILSRCATITKKETITSAGRTLYFYQK